jgi:hypothetical protein
MGEGMDRMWMTQATKGVLGCLPSSGCYVQCWSLRVNGLCQNHPNGLCQIPASIH